MSVKNLDDHEEWAPERDAAGRDVVKSQDVVSGDKAGRDIIKNTFTEKGVSTSADAMKPPTFEDGNYIFLDQKVERLLVAAIDRGDMLRRLVDAIGLHQSASDNHGLALCMDAYKPAYRKIITELRARQSSAFFNSGEKDEVERWLVSLEQGFEGLCKLCERGDDEDVRNVLADLIKGMSYSMRKLYSLT